MDSSKKLNNSCNANTENKMGTMPVGRLLLTMSVPLMISMLVQALYNIVDSIYVAMISEDALTAVSMAFPIQTVMIAVSTGTAVGMNALLSRSLGAKNFEKADLAAANGVFLGIISAVLFIFVGIFLTRPFYMSQISYNLDIVNMGVSYTRIVSVLSIGLFLQIFFERIMQGSGHTFQTMITQMTGAIINIILDPVFIFGIGPVPQMGVAGAAYATVLGQMAAAVLAILLNKKYNTDINISLKKILSPDIKIIKKIYYVGIPSIIMASIGSIMYYGMNLILTGFSSTASAVFGVYYKLQSFFFMPVFGMNNAVVPILAYNFGAHKKKRMLETLKYAIIMAVIIMLIGTLVFELKPMMLLSFFSASETMLSIGVPALKIIGIHFPVAAVCIVLGTTFQGISEAVYSAVTSIGRQIVVLLPAAYILSVTGGLGAVWWSFLIAEVSSLILTLFFFIRVNRKIISRIPD